jgi:peroxiredoxin Q/BCP
VNTVAEMFLIFMVKSAILSATNLKGEKIMLTQGTKAPDFTLSDKDGNTVSLSDFHGKKVVLYFYPKDNTPGCTRQACAFAASYDAFKQLDAVVIGISRDSVASHLKFAEKHSLPFILLSDPNLEAITAYGVWQEKKLYGKTSMGVVRSTYIIDEEGMIEKVMPKVKPDTNATEVLKALSN